MTGPLQLRYMTGYYELVDKVPHKVAVVFGNQQKLFSTHVGTLVLSNGTELKDCLFVPGLMWTLISEPRLEADGGSMTSKAGIRKVFNDTGELIISARLVNHTYVVDEPESKSVAPTMQSQTQSQTMKPSYGIVD